jgi:hypothetical protein
MQPTDLSFLFAAAAAIKMQPNTASMPSIPEIHAISPLYSSPDCSGVWPFLRAQQCAAFRR